jgi:hypothetical protein
VLVDVISPRSGSGHTSDIACHKLCAIVHLQNVWKVSSRSTPHIIQIFLFPFSFCVCCPTWLENSLCSTRKIEKTGIWHVFLWPVGTYYRFTHIFHYSLGVLFIFPSRCYFAMGQH